MSSTYDIALQNDIIVRQNNSWQPSWVITNPDGSPATMTGLQFHFVCQDALGNKIIEVLNGAFTVNANTISFLIAKAAMNLPAATYNYQLNVTYTDSTEKALFYGKLNIQKSVI